MRAVRIVQDEIFVGNHILSPARLHQQPLLSREAAGASVLAARACEVSKAATEISPQSSAAVAVLW